MTRDEANISIGKTITATIIGSQHRTTGKLASVCTCAVYTRLHGTLHTKNQVWLDDVTAPSSQMDLFDQA